MLNIDGSSKADLGFFGSGDLYIMDTVCANTTEGSFRTQIDMIRYDIETAKIDKVEWVDRLLHSIDEDSSLIVSAAVDFDGYVYYTNGVSLCVLNPDLTKSFEYVSSEYIRKLALGNKGSVYMIINASINKIDRETCATGDELTLPDDVEADDCRFGQEYDVYYSTSERIFGWSEGMEAGEMAVNWSSSCIVPGDIINLTVRQRIRFY